ncbi:4Fe-4S dicluster domain-containing protein [Desulforhopalus singaporensis]|uniref:4Fe-4S dicluster domain-containing protein n=1 Tax=Desulforhopalus singaporensis TaxID=91360 RepID=A0A1H0SQA0_9BACT|nr:4Fe-4S dicluster domain-containing protein [Desulforhopalus singaporensis]SDP43941.1 4Fe-4S dicluster domain-containing protein [Desulforhopalus singaporensis]
MSQQKFLASQSIGSFLETLLREHRVLVPLCEGDSVVFRPFRKGGGLELTRMPTTSPKEATFPRVETLMSFTQKVSAPQEEDGGKERPEIELTEHLPQDSTVVFGSRPCGAKGKTIFSRVYDTEAVKDPYFIARRDNTLFISIACSAPETTCFCTSVGGGPADSTGSDILLIPVTDGFMAEAVTEAGAKLMESAFFDAGTQKAEEAQAVVERAETKLGQAQDFSNAREKLLKLFDNESFWEEMSAKCISCGTCTYLCPTCYCFNITDETAGNTGKRVRTWDNCMDYLFTLEASTHNPRSSKAKRLKNRVGHKFSYYPSLHEEHIACCGCGRCIKSCPAAVDIRQIVKSAQEYEDVNI